MQVIVDSLLVNYQRSGSKAKTVLLLHGWGDSLKTFAGLQKALSEDFTVVSLDLPGFGGSQAPPRAWGLQEYAELAAAFLRKITVPALYAVVGHSNGGAVAIYGLAHNILKAQKLVLLGAAGIRDQQKGRRQALNALAKTGRAATAWLPASQQQKLRQKLYTAAGSDLLTVPHMQETFKKIVNQDVQAEAAQLKLPTLLIYGQDDTETPPAYGERYQNLISGSTLEVISGSGHFVHQEQPQLIQNLVQEFLV